MHDVPYGLAIWLGGLILLIVFVLYVKPWWKARRQRDASPSTPADVLDTDGGDEPSRPHSISPPAP